uniref:Bloodthirsty n=1 Tax=Neogobius melanostomus TaxID=47308 RepID=A0A8C6S819_9GOBI
MWSQADGVATVSSGWFEEQFRCCICLDIYRDPASIPCGHNFCIDCIEGYWETKDLSECPLCKEAFSGIPELRVNLGLAHVVDYIKRSLSNGGEEDSPQHSQGSLSDEVLCSVCTGLQLNAVKSCLVCQASYCDLHLGPHLRDEALQKHRLTDPATFPSSHLCRKHNKPLEMFCKKDQTPVCARCCGREHKNHQVVPIDRASKKVKASLKETKADVENMIQARIHKMEEVQQSVDAGKKSTELEIHRSVQVCTTLVSAIEQRQTELVLELQRRQEELEERAEGLLNELRTEMKDLQTRASELLHLEHTQNPLHLLQSFPSLSKLPPTRDWTEVKVNPGGGLSAVREAVTQMMEICQKMSDKLLEEEVDKLNRYAVNVTLDPATASAWLELSADGKKVSLCGQQKKLPVIDNAKRFDTCTCVLGKETFKSGRHYWVVQVGDKTDWDLGLARESVDRKGSIKVRPDCGFWAVCRRKGGSLSACTSPSQVLSLKEVPQIVGVFVDYEERLVTFYDAEQKKHIFTFRDCDLTGAVCPYFNPCVQDNRKNPPLVICPIEELREGPSQDQNMRTSL